MKLRFSALAWVAFWICSPLAGADKIDEAIDLKKQSFFPVFVRMSDQVVGRAGEYEKLCRERSGKPRAQNRKEVLSLLRGKGDKSWEKIGKTADALQEKGEVRAVRRFWIVNGFSCLAKPTAIRKLAKRADVSYVYLDRFARPLKKPPAYVGESKDCHERGSCHLEEKRARAYPFLEDSLERSGNWGRDGMEGRKRHRPGRNRRGHRYRHSARPLAHSGSGQEPQGGVER